MTISNTQRLVVATGNGATTEWPFTFLVPTAEELKVTVFDGAVNTVISSDAYSVTGIGSPTGGTVTYPLVGAPLSLTDKIIIERNVSFVQPTSFANQQRYYPSVLEAALDRLVMQTQQLAEIVSRAPTLPPTADTTELDELYGAILVANENLAEILAVNGALTEIINVEAALADVTSVADNIAAVTSVAQRYQGASASDPTVRLLDGSALQVGDFYLNTVSGNIRFVISIGPVVWAELTTLINENTLDAMNVKLTAAELNKGAQALDNKIINGAFDIWQRSTSSLAAGYVAADRWINSHSGGTVTQSRQAFNPGAGFGQNRPKFRLRQAVSGQTLASHFAGTVTRMEGVESYNGDTVTVLGFARRNSGSGNMAVEMSQFFGSGGSPSATVNGIGSQQVTLTTDWEPFAAVISVPSITGTTIGTNGNDYVEVVFWSSAGSDYNVRSASLGLQTIEVELWGIHIRVGTFSASAAWDYVQPKYDEELLRCQRYYCQTRATARFPAFNFNQIQDVQIYWPVTMRAAPSTQRYGDFSNLSAIEVNNPGTSGARFSIISNTAGDAWAINNQIFADAEL